MKKLLCLVLTLFTLVSSDCPEDLCDAVYNDVFTVLRADEGDVISPLSGQTCSSLKANCMGDSCHACKCPASKDTFDNDKEKCEDFSNDASIVYSRGGLSVNTTVSTVYFAKNAESMFELRSVATDAQLPLVGNNNTDFSNCTLYKMKISTMHSGWEEVSLDGFSLTSYNGKGFIRINPGSIKVQPEHFQGQLIRIEFKCPSKQKLYFKVQGKSINHDTCLDCDGSFDHLAHLAIPELPRPIGPGDTAINLAINALQRKGKDVSGCNEDSTINPYASYYTDSCSLNAVPGDNILYASGKSIMGRNLDPSNQNAVNWDTITDKIIKISVTCSGKKFCVLFRLTNSSSICSGNPCKNGGRWEQNGLSSCACECPNHFSGADCSLGSTCADNPCCNGATCTDNGNNYTCICPMGKTGSTCCDDINYCADQPCGEGATCTNKPQQLTYECSCPPGKTGSTCDDDVDYCADQPCGEGATCTNKPQQLIYECSCPPGKTGSTCDENVDLAFCGERRCLNGGTCNELEGSTPCSCTAGYTGQYCETDVDECESTPCENDGTCSNTIGSFVCVCSRGYAGERCTLVECDDSTCLNGGSCRNNNECVCPSGFEGDFCQIGAISASERIALEEDSNNDGSTFPYLYVVYAILGTMFILIVIGGTSGLLYKKVYSPIRSRRSQKLVVPFDNTNLSEEKHYNPMYFDSDTSLAIANDSARYDDSQSVRSIPIPSKELGMVAFANPLYQETDCSKISQSDESHYEVMEFDETNASDGIYERIDFSDNQISPEEESTKLFQKSVYDTLEQETTVPISNEYSTLGPLPNITQPQQKSIYDSLEMSTKAD